MADAKTYETRGIAQEEGSNLHLLGYTPDGESILFLHWGTHDGVFAVDVETGQVRTFLHDPEAREVQNE